MKEYGRKPYLSDNYYDMMHDKTNAEVWADTLEKHSEFEKPYLTKAGEYAKMQHCRPTIPGFGFDLGDFDFEVDPYGGYIPWHLIFNCTLTPEDCYCAGDEKCFNLTCTQEIVGIDIHDPGWGVVTSGEQVCVTAPEGKSGSVEIDVNMRAPRPWKSPHGTSEFVYGTHYNMSLSSCKADECCAATITSWDESSSAPTVAREANATVYVTGSGASIDWTVSGVGFWLDAGYSITSLAGQGTSVEIYCDASACGIGTITATSCDGTTATGYIRCTTGIWAGCSPYEIIWLRRSDFVGETCDEYMGSGTFYSLDNRFKLYGNVHCACDQGDSLGTVTSDCGGTDSSPDLFETVCTSLYLSGSASGSVIYHYWKCS